MHRAAGPERRASPPPTPGSWRRALARPPLGGLGGLPCRPRAGWTTARVRPVPGRVPAACPLWRSCFLRERESQEKEMSFGRLQRTAAFDRPRQGALRILGTTPEHASDRVRGARSWRGWGLATLRTHTADRPHVIRLDLSFASRENRAMSPTGLHGGQPAVTRFIRCFSSVWSQEPCDHGGRFSYYPRWVSPDSFPHIHSRKSLRVTTGPSARLKRFAWYS